MPDPAPTLSGRLLRLLRLPNSGVVENLEELTAPTLGGTSTLTVFLPADYEAARNSIKALAQHHIPDGDSRDLATWMHAPPVSLRLASPV